MNEAYTTIVQEKVIPYFEKMNTSLIVNVTRYLSDTDKREEILKHFARVTVYKRSLKVERIEQVVAYTFLDLISDIGKQMTLISCIGFFCSSTQPSFLPLVSIDLDRQDSR